MELLLAELQMAPEQMPPNSVPGAIQHPPNQQFVSLFLVSGPAAAHTVPQSGDTIRTRILADAMILPDRC